MEASDLVLPDLATQLRLSILGYLKEDGAGVARWKGAE
jgi:hypothetical protein